MTAGSLAGAAYLSGADGDARGHMANASHGWNLWRARRALEIALQASLHFARSLAYNFAMRIDVAFSTDDNYVKYLKIALSSILANKARGDELFFHVIHAGLLDKNIENLSYLVDSFGNISFYKVDEKEFSPYMGSCIPHITTATLYRLKLASILDVERVIYLDCDVIALSSLGKLFSADIKDYQLAAVPDMGHEIHMERLSLPRVARGFYFNAGVLYINLQKWREDGLEEELFSYLLKNWQNCPYNDQDVLNAVFLGKALSLPIKFNYIFLAASWQYKMKNEVIPKNTVIVHMASASAFKGEYPDMFFESGILSTDDAHAGFQALWTKWVDRKCRCKTDTKSVALQELEILEKFLDETPEHEIKETASYIVERVKLNIEKMQNETEENLVSGFGAVFERVKKYLSQPA